MKIGNLFCGCFVPRTVCIDKSSSKLYVVPSDIYRYARTLEELDLNNNQINELPKPFFNLKRLKRLVLNGNDLSYIPNEIGNLTQLQELDLTHNSLQGLPENIKFCKNLQVMNFGNNPVESIPSGLLHIKNLTYLALNDSNIVDVPAAIGNLTKLTGLSLRENIIEFIPQSANKVGVPGHWWKPVRVPAPEHSTFKESGGAVARSEWTQATTRVLHPNLTLSLSLSLARQRQAHKGLSQAISPALEEQRPQPPHKETKILTKRELRSLEILDLTDNQVEYIPEEICDCVSMTHLTLSQNFLQSLPRNLGELRSLEILDLTDNQVEYIPEEICECVSMTHLTLSQNFLQSLPRNLAVEFFPFEIQLRASDRMIFQTILNQNNITEKNKKFILIAISHHFLLLRQYTKYGKYTHFSSTSSAGSLYLKREKFYSCFKLVTIFSCHPSPFCYFSKRSFSLIYKVQSLNTDPADYYIAGKRKGDPIPSPQKLLCLLKHPVLAFLHPNLSLSLSLSLSLQRQAHKGLSQAISPALEEQRPTPPTKELKILTKRELRSLEILDLTDNQVEYIPEEICDCVSMTHLTLSQNFLQSLPRNLGNLRKLEILKATRNRIAAIPETIGSCSSSVLSFSLSLSLFLSLSLSLPFFIFLSLFLSPSLSLPFFFNYLICFLPFFFVPINLPVAWRHISDYHYIPEFFGILAINTVFVFEKPRRCWNLVTKSFRNVLVRKNS
eukprot:sb/3479354/